MSDVSRRSFLHGVGVTAAVAGVAAVVPSASAAPAPDDDAGRPDAATATLVVYVEDAATGRLSVLSGDREVVVTDRRLAQRLARLAD